MKWDGKGEWYEAKVLRYDAKSARHAVRYTDDGVEQPEDLARMWYGRSWRLKKAAPPPKRKEEAGAEERQLYEKILAEFQSAVQKKKSTKFEPAPGWHVRVYNLEQGRRDMEITTTLIVKLNSMS